MPASTAFLTALKPLTTRAVNIRVLSSLNNYGEAQYSGSATEYAAYIEKVTRSNLSIRNFVGSTVSSCSARMWCQAKTRRLKQATKSMSTLAA